MRGTLDVGVRLSPHSDLDLWDSLNIALGGIAHVSKPNADILLVIDSGYKFFFALELLQPVEKKILSQKGF